MKNWVYHETLVSEANTSRTIKSKKQYELTQILKYPFVARTSLFLSEHLSEEIRLVPVISLA